MGIVGFDEEKIQGCLWREGGGKGGLLLLFSDPLP